jgi:hypothetical protein
MRAAQMPIWRQTIGDANAVQEGFTTTTRKIALDFHPIHLLVMFCLFEKNFRFANIYLSYRLHRRAVCKT